MKTATAVFQHTFIISCTTWHKTRGNYQPIIYI